MNSFGKKTQGTGFLDAKRKPLRAHENVLVFSEKSTVYNPQFSQGKPYIASRHGTSEVYSNTERIGTISDGRRYPTSVIKFARPQNVGHPTAKPVELFEWLIKTYTDAGATVLDCCLGSGTTAIAAERSGRRWIGIEKEREFVDLASARILTELN